MVWRWLLGSVGVLVLTATLGCRSPEPIFPDLQPARQWPPGDRPRIRYVGELRSSADLKAVRSWPHRLWDVLFGGEAPASLYAPRAITKVPGDRLWVADPGGRCLHLFDLNQRQYRQVRQVGGDGRLEMPVSVAPGPRGTIIVCDSAAAAVQLFAANDGQWLATLAKAPDVLRPVSATYLPAAGELVVVDGKSHNLKVFDLEGRSRRIIGVRGGAPGQFNFPVDIVFDGEWLWVADAGNHRVQALDPAGKSKLILGAAGDAPGDLALPKGIAVDRDGHVYVVDARFENIQVFNREAQLLMHWGREGKEPGEFALPSGIFIDETDRVWVCDSYNRRIQVFDYLKKESSNVHD